MEQLQQKTTSAESQTQQGAPHLSGSGAPPPDDPGGGEALQGSEYPKVTHPCGALKDGETSQVPKILR